jgi:hypothetical protein
MRSRQGSRYLQLLMMRASWFDFHKKIVDICMVWGVMSGDRPGPVGDLEDPFGVLQVGPPGTAPARDSPRSA